MKVVVTGGAGFIGSHVCEALTRRGFDVVAIDDLSTGRADNLAGTAVELRVASILDPSVLAAATAGAVSVVHLAARPSVPRSLADPIGSHDTNVTGTLHVLEAARDAGAHVVVASSSSVYGAEQTLPQREDMAPRPLSPYAASKLAAESYVLAYGQSFNLPTLAVRLFNVFGPRQRPDCPYAAVVPRFVQAAISDQTLQVNGDGTQTRDFTYVGSVADAVCDAVVHRVAHDRPVNLAFGNRTSVLTIAALVSEILGRPMDVSHLPARPGEVRDSQAATATMRRLLPGVKQRDLKAALTDTIAWHLANRTVAPPAQATAPARGAPGSSHISTGP